jgi:hypothetical protein
VPRGPRYHKRFINVPATVNGVLAGLVSITAGCATLGSLATIATGAAAGLVYYLSSLYVKRLRIDDAMDGMFALAIAPSHLSVVRAAERLLRRQGSPCMRVAARWVCWWPGSPRSDASPRLNRTHCTTVWQSSCLFKSPSCCSSPPSPACAVFCSSGRSGEKAG